MEIHIPNTPSSNDEFDRWFVAVLATWPRWKCTAWMRSDWQAVLQQYPITVLDAVRLRQHKAYSSDDPKLSRFHAEAQAIYRPMASAVIEADDSVDVPDYPDKSVMVSVIRGWMEEDPEVVQAERVGGMMQRRELRTQRHVEFRGEPEHWDDGMLRYMWLRWHVRHDKRVPTRSGRKATPPNDRAMTLTEFCERNPDGFLGRLKRMHRRGLCDDAGLVDAIFGDH